MGMTKESSHLFAELERAILEAKDSGAPIDVFELARACGLYPVPWHRPYGELREGEIRYPGLAPEHVQRAIIATELVKAALEVTSSASAPRADRAPE